MNSNNDTRRYTYRDAERYVYRNVKTTDGRVVRVVGAAPTANFTAISLLVEHVDSEGHAHYWNTDNEHATIVKEP